MRDSLRAQVRRGIDRPAILSKRSHNLSAPQVSHLQECLEEAQVELQRLKHRSRRGAGAPTDRPSLSPPSSPPTATADELAEERRLRLLAEATFDDEVFPTSLHIL